MSRLLAAAWCGGQELEDFGIRVFKDGNQWCALVGPDLMGGVAGFGPTPIDALLELAVELMDKAGVSE